MIWFFGLLAETSGPSPPSEWSGGSGRAASRRPDPPASVLGGKNLCREVRSYAHDEAVAVTSGTEASPITAIRMGGLRVPTGGAEDHRHVGVIAG